LEKEVVKGKTTALVSHLIYLGFWIFSIVGTIKGKEKLIPLVGTYFQKWFTFIQ